MRNSAAASSSLGPRDHTGVLDGAAAREESAAHDGTVREPELGNDGMERIRDVPEALAARFQLKGKIGISAARKPP